MRATCECENCGAVFVEQGRAEDFGWKSVRVRTVFEAPVGDIYLFGRDGWVCPACAAEFRIQGVRLRGGVPVGSS